MKFGVIFQVPVPRPWTAESERRAYGLALEQAVLADELGFDNVWAVEHHFLEEYSHCSSPEIFLTALACHTKNIRIGHGICTVLPGFNHAVRAAERAAWIDLVSDGRLEFGTGRSSTWTELGGFGVDPDRTKDMWDDSLRAIVKMWTQEQFSWDSEFLKVPPRAILPKPYQRPHPPLWVAVSSPETAVQAAERGIGMLGVSIGTPQEFEVRVAEYHKRIQQCDPVGDFVNEQSMALSWLYVDEDRDRGRQVGERLVGNFVRVGAQLYSINQAYPADSYNTPGLLFALRRDVMSDSNALIKEGFAIGDPDDVTRALKMWESAGLDGVTFLLNAGEFIPQEEVLRSLRLFAREVMPRFNRGLNGATRAAKQNGKGPEVQCDAPNQAAEPAPATTPLKMTQGSSTEG